MRLKLSNTLLLGILLLFIPSMKAQEKVSGDSIIRFAHNYLDTPYRTGGSSPKAFDCSGFSSFVYRHFGYELNRCSCDQVKDGIEVSKNALKPGDLVLFKGRNAKAKRVGHVGIVVEADGNGGFKFIHASVKYGVTINNGEQPYYKSRYVTARRILKDNSEDTFRVKEKSAVQLAPLSASPIKLSVSSSYLSDAEKIKPHQYNKRI